MSHQINSDTSQSLPTTLRDFQLSFGDYLRSQTLDEQGSSDNTANSGVDNKLGIPKRAGQVYQELVFNNLTGFINQCFPVCQTLMSQKDWRALTLQFFQQGELHSPYFTEINQHFINYLYAIDDKQHPSDALLSVNIPPYLPDLAHYEYVELLLDIQPDNTPTSMQAIQIYPEARLNPALQNLHYSWAVHCISAAEQPTEPSETFLLVYRTPEYQVEFMAVNAMTHTLIGYIQEQLTNSDANANANAKQKDKGVDSLSLSDGEQVVSLFSNKAELLTAFLTDLGVAEDQLAQFVGFGEQLLEQLETQQVVLIE